MIVPDPNPDKGPKFGKNVGGLEVDHPKAA
jgi:hypothetical protein